MLLGHTPAFDADGRSINTIGELCNVAPRVQPICHTQLRIDIQAPIIVAWQTRDGIRRRLDAEPHQSQVSRNPFTRVQSDAA